jgi:predicted aspartyl protease
MDGRVGWTPQSRTRALAALCLLWSASAGTATTGAAVAGEEIRYREAWGYAVVVPVYIQGLGPFEFLLDTGADTTVVHPDLARRLGLRPTARIELMTLAGSRIVPLATLPTMRVGGTSLDGVEVLIHDMAAARAADGRLDGILGRNALRETSFTIDHARRRVRLGGPATAGGVPYEEIEGRLVIAARLGCAGDPIRLALDSGIADVVLFEGSRPLPVTATSRVTARTNAGDTALRSGRLDALCLGSARLDDVAVAVQARDRAEGRIEDGLVPTRLFARVHFDPHHKTVRLEPW